MLATNRSTRNAAEGEAGLSKAPPTFRYTIGRKRPTSLAAGRVWPNEQTSAASSKAGKPFRHSRPLQPFGERFFCPACIPLLELPSPIDLEQLLFLAPGSIKLDLRRGFIRIAISRQTDNRSRAVVNLLLIAMSRVL